MNFQIIIGFLPVKLYIIELALDMKIMGNTDLSNVFIMILIQIGEIFMANTQYLWIYL